MGFSPGSFTVETRAGHQKVHWEAKDAYVVLWLANESDQLFRFNYDEAIEALDQLRTAISAVTGEDPI